MPPKKINLTQIVSTKTAKKITKKSTLTKAAPEVDVEEPLGPVENAHRLVTKLLDHLENLYEPNTDLEETYQSEIKSLYDHLKSIEPPKFSAKNAVSELLIDGFNDVQIWEQLKNHLNHITTIADKKQSEWLERSNETLTQYDNIPDVNSRDDFNDNDIYDDEDDFDESMFLNGEGEMDFNRLDHDINMDGEGEFDALDSEGDDFFEDEPQLVKPHRNFPKSPFDDEFFSLEEMERFADEAEAGEGEGIDLFAEEFMDDLDYDDEDDENPMNIKFEDFFGPRSEYKGGNDNTNDPEEDFAPKSKRLHPTKDSQKRKGKTAIWDAEDEDELDNDIDEYNNNDTDTNYLQFDDSQHVMDHLMTPYMLRQQQLAEQIDALERDIGGPRSFEMKGEVNSFQRKKDSLIYEDVEFMQGARIAAPVSADWGLEIEQILKQRIRDNVFDDVQPRYDVQNGAIDGLGKVREEGKQLSSEKPRFGLAEEYEREFRTLATGVDDISNELQAKYNEISYLFTKVTQALDGLSNYHYSAKPKIQEFSVTSTTNVTQKEEVAPGGATAGSLSVHGASILTTTGSVAPQELHQAQDDGLTASKGEMSQHEKELAIKRRKESKKKHRLHEEASIQEDAKRGVKTAKRQVEASALQKEYAKATKSGSVTVHSSVAPGTKGVGSMSTNHKYTTMSGVVNSIAQNDQAQTLEAKKSKRAKSQQELGKFTNSKSVMQ